MIARHALQGRTGSGNPPLSHFVTLHPYFKVHAGKLETFTTALPGFIARTRSEEKNLFYEFTINGDEVFCREAYTDAEGLLAHLDNVGSSPASCSRELASRKETIVASFAEATASQERLVIARSDDRRQGTAEGQENRAADKNDAS